MTILPLLLTGLVAFPAAPPRFLLVGGGPEKEHNQVGIESNVRYMERLMPKNAERRILFADGDRASETVKFLDSANAERYRAPRISQIDGPARLANVTAEIGSLNATRGSAFVYFTGHGSPDRGRFDNNVFDLWSKDTISVKELAANIGALPKSLPVTLVMVQCFSGAFANVLFEAGDPQGAPVERDICGFFASVPIRMSAGCTPTTDESDYHDFTGYFFSALTGTARTGEKVTGADFDRNGKVGMNEAFAYTLINDVSIDTQTCTSDAFRRRSVTETPYPETPETPYSSLLKWASPAQRAALEALSTQLSATGEGRFASLYDEFRRSNPQSDAQRDIRIIRFVRLAKSVTLAHLLESNPDKSVRQRYARLLKAEAKNPFAL